MTSFVRIEELTDMVNEMQHKIATYVIAQKNSATAAKTAHLADMARCHEETEALQRKYLELEKEEKQALKGQESRSAAVCELERSVLEAGDSQQQAALHAESLALHIALLENQKTQLQQQIIDTQRTHQKSSAEVVKALGFFADRLALQFDRVGETGLRFRFTQIDADQPDREFVFAVTIDKQGLYHVHDVVPSVDGVSELIEQLNATNDFAAFVRAIRRAFKIHAIA
eukprot:m.187711 g.187711  ORF g.187711 m.187711 type:complete len:228 (-) comp53580_c0_seq1:99-782(-)